MYRSIIISRRPRIHHSQIRGQGFVSWLKRTGRRIFGRARESLLPRLRPAVGTIPTLFLGDPNEQQRSLEVLKNLGREVLSDVGDETKKIIQDSSRSLLKRIRGGSIIVDGRRHSLSTKTGLNHLVKELDRHYRLINQSKVTKDTIGLPGSTELNARVINPLVPIESRTDNLPQLHNLNSRQHLEMGYLTDHQKDVGRRANMYSELETDYSDLSGAGTAPSSRTRKIIKGGAKTNLPVTKIESVGSNMRGGASTHRSYLGGQSESKTIAKAPVVNYTDQELEFLRQAKSIRF